MRSTGSGFARPGSASGTTTGSAAPCHRPSRGLGSGGRAGSRPTSSHSSGARSPPGVPKVTMPAPDVMHFFLGPRSIDPDAYGDVEEYYADLVAIYQAEIRDLVALGCRALQLDDTALPCNCDERVRAEVRARGEDPDALTLRYVGLINESLAACPPGVARSVHMCRGNLKGAWMAEGGYEPIAEAVFGGLAVDAFLLEFDSPRAGDFRALRFVPAPKRVILGLVSTKTPALETPTRSGAGSTKPRGTSRSTGSGSRLSADSARRPEGASRSRRTTSAGSWSWSSPWPGTSGGRSERARAPASRLDRSGLAAARPDDPHGLAARRSGGTGSPACRRREILVDGRARPRASAVRAAALPVLRPGGGPAALADAALVQQPPRRSRPAPAAGPDRDPADGAGREDPLAGDGRARLFRDALRLPWRPRSDGTSLASGTVSRRSHQGQDGSSVRQSQSRHSRACLRDRPVDRRSLRSLGCPRADGVQGWGHEVIP